MPAPLSAIECSLAGDPIEAICREIGCSKSWVYKWNNRYEASKPNGFQERSRRPRSTPTHTPEALERAIVR
jgi:transposase-like protein